MPHRAVITFSSSKFVGDDLFIFALLHHFRGDFCAVDRCAVSDLLAIGVHQDVGEHDLLTCLGLQQIDIDRVAFRDAILPATGLDDCKSHTGEFFRGKKPRNVAQKRQGRKSKPM
jgi:hypothetical protein